jgi:alpha-L-rhamnosidase
LSVKYKQVKKKVIKLVAMIFLLCVGQCTWALTVSHLRTEAVKNPLGIDVDRPKFSWILESNERNVRQTAYQIRLFSDTGHTGELWTSGQIASCQSVDVPYSGEALQASTRYFWNVTVWDNQGGNATSDEFSYFETGLLNSGWSGAQWIKATSVPQSAGNYDLDLDIVVVRDAAGVIFSASDEKTFHLWSFNIRDNASPLLRRHVFTNGNITSSDVNLGSFITKQQLLNSTHHVKISVRDKIITTYLDDVLIDTYNDVSTHLLNGFIGFRAYRDSYKDSRMDELAYFDNIRITRYEGGNAGQIIFSEDFQSPAFQFTEGSVEMKNGSRMLIINSPYQEKIVLQDAAMGMPMFRKEFQTQANIKSAKLYATALGVYDVFINGERTGNLLPGGDTQFDELKPGFTDYFKEVSYLSYDVTHLLQSGANVIGSTLGSGWWGGEIAHGIYGSPSLGFMAKLLINYEDGTSDSVVTNTTWQCATNGAILRGDIYDGETYDARRESDWAKPGYDDSDWRPVALNTEFKGVVTAFKGQTVRVREHLQLIPKKITVYEGITDTGTTYGQINVTRNIDNQPVTVSNGQTLIYDMGQNFAGWIKIKVRGEPGTSLKFRFAEMLNDNGAASRTNDGPGGSVYTYNMRTAAANLNYIMKGSADEETYQPSTTFYGFRYVEVTVSGTVEILSLTGEVVGSDIEEESAFATSHPDVNRLYSNVQWSQRANFLSIPTDCPQRDERLGWTGDTQIFARAAIYNADTRAFYHKWMGDMRASQRADGAYPDLAPYCWYGFGNAAWGDAGIIVPYTVYLMYGDKSILEENYESMTHYMDFLATQKDDAYNYIGAGTSFGDWLAYESIDARYVSVCYYAYVAQLMEKICLALSETANDACAVKAQSYATLYGNIKEEFNARYVNPSNGTLKVSTQTAYLLALKMNLLPSETANNRAIASLRQKIVNNGYKLSTGFVGTGTLNQTLSRYNQDDMAFNLLLQRGNPSWLYSIDQGATTIWERWDSYTIEKGFNDHSWIMNSFNHYSYGVISEWFFRTVAGIEADETNPGFKHFILQPTPDNRTQLPQNQQRITWADAVFHSAYGKIASHWIRKDDGRIIYSATVPANTTATLYLPVLMETDLITENNLPAATAGGVTALGMANGKAVFDLQSGAYEFEVHSGLSQGVYFCSVQNSQACCTQKFIKN